MVVALIALLATLAGLAATGLLFARTFNERRPHLIAWSLAVAGLTLAVGAMAAGGLAGFSGMLFRLMEVGGALIAPVFLAVGVAELISHYVQVRFAAWLVAISYSIVAVVIALFDPVETRTFGHGIPSPSAGYSALPVTLINVAHVIVVIALAACTGVTAMRARNRDREAYEYQLPVALAALAGVFVVAGAGGYLPGVLEVFALGAAAGLVTYSAIQTAPYVEDEPHPRGEDQARRHHAPDRMQVQGAPPGYPPPVQSSIPPSVQAAMAPPPAAPLPPPMSDPFPPALPVADPIPQAGSPTGPTPGGLAMYGQITVYTLFDGRVEAFDRLAQDAVQAARAVEPDLLIFTSHEVAGAPNQRIFYQLFRDFAAYTEHQRQPHLQRFLADARPHVVSTNVIELKLGAAKVLPLPSLTGGFSL
jgi:quinol monooxygenase YgiN